MGAEVSFRQQSWRWAAQQLQQLWTRGMQPSPLGLLLIYRLLKFNHGLKRWLAKHLTPAGMGVLVALFVFGLIGLDVKRSVSYQLFVFLLALLMVAVVLARCMRCRVSAVRQLPRFGIVDVPLRYRVRVQNHRGGKQAGFALSESFEETFPSLAEFRGVMRAQGGQKAWMKFLAQRRWAFVPKTEVPVLVGKGETEVEADLIPLRRGLLTFNKLTLACAEPLGLVNRCVTLARPEQVLILPKRYRLPVIELPGARRYQADGLSAAASVGDSEEFRALREYRPGDSPRKIHWKSWAKTGKPIIKEEQAEYAVRHALILDTFQAERYSDAMEEAVAIAASFACTLQTTGQSQESLLDMLFMGDRAHGFTVGRGLGKAESLLALLASAVPCQDRSFETLLPVVRSRLSLLSGCICIFLDWDSDRKALIEQLQAANIPTLGLIIASEEGLAEPLDRSCLRNSQSSLHILPLNNIQETLLTL
ncbi:MAG: DUF58 domain-containing protein [Cyanobacteria bacterium J06598_1]